MSTVKVWPEYDSQDSDGDDDDGGDDDIGGNCHLSKEASCL